MLPPRLFVSRACKPRAWIKFEVSFLASVLMGTRWTNRETEEGGTGDDQVTVGHSPEVNPLVVEERPILASQISNRRAVLAALDTEVNPRHELIKWKRMVSL